VLPGISLDMASKQQKENKMKLKHTKRQIPERNHNNKNTIENGKRKAMIHRPQSANPYWHRQLLLHIRFTDKYKQT
jgi:hypothetical protein